MKVLELVRLRVRSNFTFFTDLQTNTYMNLDSREQCVNLVLPFLSTFPDEQKY